MVPLNTPVWAEHKGKEYRHPGSGHPSNWDDKFDVKTDEEELEYVRESIQALKKKKARSFASCHVQGEMPVELRRGPRTAY